MEVDIEVNENNKRKNAVSGFNNTLNSDENRETSC